MLFLFSLSPKLVVRKHKQVNASLPTLSTSKTSCAALGEVYHKAWLASGGLFRTKIEQDCIQDLMYRGALATRGKGGMAIAVLRMLTVLHKLKRFPFTQTMLSRL